MSVSEQKMTDKGSPGQSDGHAQKGDGVHRILLIDEQAHVLRVIRMNLERCGYLVDAVVSAELALQHVRDFPYDALVMTSDLPDMTSEQLCEQTQIVLNGCNPCSQKPLLLVGLDEGVDWSEEVDNRIPLGRPVSLKSILAYLEEHFERTACEAGRP